MNRRKSLPKTPYNYTILTTTERNLDVRMDQFSINSTYPLYNVLAVTLAGLGKFSPLGAVLSMLASFSIMLLSVSRLSKVQEVRE